MSAAVVLPDDADNVPMLHRRLYPFDNSNADVEAEHLGQEIALLRCLHFESRSRRRCDVHTVSAYRTVPNGKLGQPPSACAGLSIAPTHDSTAFVVETNRDAGDFDEIVWIGGEEVKRWFCYRAPSDSLPSRYKINRDKPFHAHIYSPEECILEIPANSETVDVMQAVYKALLPEISSMPWEFCGSLLAVSQAKYDQLLSRTYVPPTFRDNVVANLHAAFSESQFTSKNISNCDDSRELCDWLEDHFQDGSLDDLSRHPTVLDDMIVQLTEHHFETEDVTCSIRAYELRRDLEAIAEELEARPKAGTS